MISADFYPTQETHYTVEYTDIIPNLTYDNPETAAAPYYMGYLNWDDVPSMMHMSKMNVVSEATEAYTEFVDITEAENAPWFFTGCFSSSPYNTSGNGMYIVDSTTGKYVKPANNGYFYDFGFFNNLEIQRVSSSGGYTIYAARNIINNATTPPTYYTSQQETLFTEDESSNISWDYMRQWLNGEVKLYTQNYTVNDVTERFEITPDDLMAGRCEKEFTLTDATLQLYISDYIVPSNSRDVQPNGSTAGWSRQNAAVLLHANVDGETKPYITNTTSWHTGYSDEKYVYITNSGTGLSHHRIGYTGTIMGGFSGRIPSTFFTNADRGRWYFFGNFAVMRYTNETVRMQRVIPLTEIIKYFSTLFTRIINGSSSIYGFSDSVYYPLFNDDNSPKWEYVTGLQEDIQDELQEWQYTNITANTFTEADIPEYEPPGPGPEPGGEPDEGDWGDPVGISQTIMGDTAFSNFEVVRRAGLLEFVSELWEAPADFWQSLSILGEVTANLGDYLISCRAYPVQLNVGNVHKDIYIGAGGKITLAADVYNTATTNWIQMGSITIPRQYKNFLDYNPYTSATISLPFAGTFEINPKYLYDSQIDLKLVVDITDGSGMWILENLTHYFPILIKQCRIAADIPISGLNASQMASNILNATLTNGQHALSSINKIGGAAVQTGAAIASGGAIGAEGALSMATMGAQVGIQALTDATNMAMGNKEIPFYTGGSGGAAAAEGNFEPYITLRRPLCTNPENYAHTVGNLVNKTATISSLNGFTICRNVDINGIDQATDKEKAQIKQILESGFYA